MERKLKRNFSLMFWLEAFTEVKMINVVTAIFLVFRGLTVAQIFYTTIVFSISTILFELPSSYLADRWGRKRVIVLSALLNLSTWIIFIFAHNLVAFCLAFATMAVSDALMSGTDEAMIFDTSKALGARDKSLEKLGAYFSAKRLFKIFTPVLAALIAKDLADSQFVLLLLVDTVAGLLALILSIFLVEPSHFFQLEKAERGVFRDALNMFRSNPKLIKTMLNRSLFFVSNFAIWRISSEMFRSVGISILLIGLTNSFYQLVLYFLNRRVNKFWTRISVEDRVNRLGNLTFVSILFLLINRLWWQNNYLDLLFFCGMVIFESLRWPMFSEIYNRLSGSYNRATVLSLSNLTKSVLEIPTMFLFSIVVTRGYSFLITWCLIITLVPMVFFRLENKVE